MSKMLEDSTLASQLEASASAGGRKLFDRVGGRAGLAKVHKFFYDKIYGHPWLGMFFRDIDQKHIEDQQTAFMSMLFGGPKEFSGRMPIDAHEHIMITEELFQVRTDLLQQSLAEAQIGPAETQDWLRIDAAFKKVLIKSNRSDCRKRYFTDEILDFPPPQAIPRAS